MFKQLCKKQLRWNKQVVPLQNRAWASGITELNSVVTPLLPTDSLMGHNKTHCIILVV